MQTIRTYTRLHIGLLDLGNVTLRAYGGLGVALALPVADISAEPSDHNQVDGADTLDNAALSDLDNLLDRMLAVTHGRSVKITTKLSAPQHVGLGTKTSLMLGVAKAVDLVYQLGLEDQDVQSITGRGGTSGIGVHAFFKGGFLVDAGHPVDQVKAFAPSSSRLAPVVPPLTVSLPVSPDWRFHLVLPKGRRFSGQDERDFFATNTPIPRDEVLTAIAHAYHGIVPAIALSDLQLLKHALSEFHKVGFKRRELENHSDLVKGMLRDLQNIPRCAVGMSSMGPLLYAVVHQSDEETAQQVQHVALSHGSDLIGAVQARNDGYGVITYGE